MGGYIATAALRCQTRLRDLPIIAMTADAMVGSLPGIDVATWLNSRMGDTELYRRLHGMFLAVHLDLQPQRRHHSTGGPACCLRGRQYKIFECRPATRAWA